MGTVAVLNNRIDGDMFLNPKQELFLKYYLDPKSETFSRPKESGMKAGYSESYSMNIINQLPSWLEETIGDARMVRLAEDNIKTLLVQDEDIKVKADMTKFVASTLGKKKYSTKTDVDITSNGESINQINYIVPAEAKVITEDNIREAEVRETPVDEIIPNTDPNTDTTTHAS